MLKRKQNMFCLMHGLKSTDTPVMDFLVLIMNPIAKNKSFQRLHP